MANTASPIGRPQHQIIPPSPSAKGNETPVTRVSLAALDLNCGTFDWRTVRPPLIVSAPSVYEDLGITFTQDALTKTPKPLDFDALTERGKDVDVDELIQEYRKFFPNATEAEYRPLRSIVERARQETPKDILQLLIQNIVLLLRQDAISIDKKMSSLEIIAGNGNFLPQESLRSVYTNIGGFALRILT